MRHSWDLFDNCKLLYTCTSSEDIAPFLQVMTRIVAKMVDVAEDKKESTPAGIHEGERVLKGSTIEKKTCGALQKDKRRAQGGGQARAQAEHHGSTTKTSGWASG